MSSSPPLDRHPTPTTQYHRRITPNILSREFHVLTDKRFFWVLVFIPFSMLLMESQILPAKLGPNAFVDVTGWKMSREAVVFTAVLFTLLWLFNIIVLW